MRVPVCAAALALAVSGCLVPERAVRAPATVGPDAAAVAALGDSLARAPSPEARRGVAVRALRAAGVTPLAGGRFTTGVRAPLVAGFVPGRAPGRSGELVVVGASLDGPGAADAVEAARVLVDLSLAGTVPERTVGVVLWTGSAGGAGLRAAVRGPLWPRDAVAAAVVVGEGAADAVGGVPVTAVAPGPGLAARLVEAALARAAAPAVAPPAP